MKKIKIISILTIMVSILFMGKANADFPTTITASGIFPNDLDDYRLTLNSSGIVVTNPNNIKTYPTFRVKTYDSDTKYWHCLSGLAVQYPQNGVTCTLQQEYDSSWTEANAAATAYIINLLNSATCPSSLSTDSTQCHSNGDTTTCTVNCTEAKYYWKDTLILYAIDKFGYTYGGTTYDYPSKVDNLSVFNLGKASTIVSTAKNVNTKTPTITPSAAITFSEYPSQDGYYYSNIITITPANNTAFSVGGPTNSKFTLVSLGSNKYQFKIKASDIELDGTESFSITSTATNKFYIAKRYNCANNPNGKASQSMALDTLDTTTKTKTLTLSGSVTRKSYSIKINKVDDYSNKVKGAKFELKTASQKTNNLDGTIKTTNANGAITFDKLDTGTYYLTENVTPDEYNVNEKEYKIVIAYDGTITVDGKAQSTNTITIKNTLTETSISKKSAVTGDEVPGAKLQILDKDKKEISCNIKNAKGKLETLDNCEWTSVEEAVSIIGLPKGKYYLVEILAPKGYELNPNAVEFEVLADGKVLSVEMVDQIEVDVPNTLSSRSSLLLAIAMVDIALGIGIITYVKKNKIEE